MKITVIGSGFAGLSAAAMLAKENNEVHVFEKNKEIGGRSRQFQFHNFLFDMGPSWYWMPDVFEQFFQKFGYSTSDFFELKKLDPGFQIIYPDNECIQIPSEWEELLNLFENIEKGSAKKLEHFILDAAYKYDVGMNSLVKKPGLSITEFLHPYLLKDIFKLTLFSSYSKHVRKYFTHPKLIRLMEFPVLFLGSTPQNTPALYSLMNYAGLKIGTYYPMGGMVQLVQAMKKVVEEQGVIFHTSEPVQKIDIAHHTINRISTSERTLETDGVIAAADYHHVEQQLLPEKYRNYSEEYWDQKTLAPSCLIFYIGVSKKIDKLIHHNLFFDEDIDLHAKEIYTDKKWPTNPLFYVCCPSKTDPEVAPEGMENVFILMPIAPGLKDTSNIIETYYHMIMERIEKYVGSDISKHVLFKKSYCISDFQSDYNAYKGNAYGLANTLDQTAIFKPKMKSKKINNLFFAGQLTSPGPGVPPSIISGQVAAELLTKTLTPTHESVI